jgi:hypothetical protein
VKAVFRNRAAAVAAGSALFVFWATLAGSAAEAVRPPVRATQAAAASELSRASTKEPETTSSVGTPAEGERECLRSRKRLWVEGEGWVVRRVTTCF